MALQVVHDGAIQEDALVNKGNALAAMAEHVAFTGDRTGAMALLQRAAETYRAALAHTPEVAPLYFYKTYIWGVECILAVIGTGATLKMR
eukprot:4445850-Pyramimonas_sp.AAC.1